MAIDKNALREAVFRHYEREVNAETSWNNSRKELEIQKKKSQYDTAMRTETAGEYLFFSSLSPEEYEKEMAAYEQDSDPDVTDRFKTVKLNEQNYRLKTENMNDPGGVYMRGLFAPVTDSSRVRLGFRDKDFEKMLGEAQARIDSIKIPVPEGLDESAVSYAVLGEFLRDDLISSTFDEMKKMQAGGGSTIPRYMNDKAVAVKESFLKTSST